MRYELTVSCEVPDNGKPQTVTVVYDGEVIGMLLISPLRNPSDNYVREQRAALAGMLLASINAATVKVNARLEDEARKKAADDAKYGM